jgi:hypothetical protein
VRWTWFYWLLVGLGVANLIFVAWAFRRDLALRKRQDEEEDSFRYKRKVQKAWEETKATLKDKIVWLLSLFFFFHLGVGITAGGEYAECFHSLCISDISIGRLLSSPNSSLSH